MDIDLPGYAWDLLPFKERPLDLYKAPMWHAEYDQNKRSPYAALQTSLGCQFGCTFCMINILNRDDNNEIGIESDDEDNIYVCKNLIDNRIRFGGCLAAYILKNSDHNLEIADLLGEMFFGQNKKWFNLF